MFRAEVLAGVLTQEQRQSGFTLREADDHCLWLYFQGKRVALFSATGATVQEIRKAADCIRSKN